MPREIYAIREKFGSPQVETLVEGVFIRPQMYSIGGTVFEVAAFLEGYYSGAARDKYWTDTSWQDFNLWLLAEIGGELHNGWHWLYQKIIELYPQNDLALDFLLEKFLQFQKNKTLGMV
jgi:hypothetical protein